MREQTKVFPERFLTTPYSAPYHQDRNCHVDSFLLTCWILQKCHLSSRKNYRREAEWGTFPPHIFPAAEAGTWQHGGEPLVLRNEVMELEEWEKSAGSPKSWGSWAGFFLQQLERYPSSSQLPGLWYFTQCSERDHLGAGFLL